MQDYQDAPSSAAMHDDDIDKSSAQNTVQHESTEEIDDNILCLSTPFDICIPCNSCFIVSERSSYVELFFGKYHGTITQPGCYCRTSLFFELRPINTDIVTYDLDNTKVLDLNGSPVIVSGIITYDIVNARRATIDVSDVHKFIRDQAPAILKRIVSQFPYESDDSNVPCLRKDTDVIAMRMKDALQKNVGIAGIRVVSFHINELSYAPEIAQAMLKRQQAEALIAARRAVVNGAAGIAKDAVNGLEECLSEQQKAALLANLLVVLVGDKDTTPTYSIAS